MPSRISGACTPCRSKKQKCSGHHPICTQCENASVDCTWPEQRKRGPAKGYIEALESRLHSAESLLLAVLPLVNDNTLERASQALQQDLDDDGDGIRGKRSSPPTLNKKTGLDYWDQFPIDNRWNIRKWQNDCEAQSNSTTNHINQDTTGASRYRSRTHSPGSVGIASPHGSASSMTQQQSNWTQSMQPYIAHQNQMQAGAAQQLVNLSSHSHRRDHWVAQQNPDSMQLDPHIMHQQQQQQQHQHQHQQSRPLPPQSFAVNTQPHLFW